VYWSVWVLAAFRVYRAGVWGGEGEEGFFLWALGFQKFVKDFIGKHGVVVIQMVAG